MKARSVPARWLFGCLVAAGLAGCGTTEEAAGGGSPARTGAGTPASRSPLGLADDSEEVRTVQLYAGRDERAAPILAPGEATALTLAFDLVGSGTGRPLSVYYLHADRTWRRDLFPAQYLDGFEREDLLRYENSRATRVPYVHYEATLPGPSTRFTISGNYVARVTELGQPDAVLFERPFFVAEASTAADAAFVDSPFGGLDAQFQPSVRLALGGGDPFGFAACFARDGLYAAARCTDRPYRTEPSALTFLLPPETAFRRSADLYVVDLRDLRRTNRLAAVDALADPPTVELAADDATFPEALAPSQNGQIVVEDGARTAGAADLTAEYAEVTFALVPPDEIPFRDAYLEGSFSGWTPRAHPLTWVPERRRHEGTVLLKQGVYEYRYASTDARLGRAQAASLGRPDARYTALVYYRDARLQTDRLVAARTLRAQP